MTHYASSGVFIYPFVSGGVVWVLGCLECVGWPLPSVGIAVARLKARTLELVGLTLFLALVSHLVYMDLEELASETSPSVARTAGVASACMMIGSFLISTIVMRRELQRTREARRPSAALAAWLAFVLVSSLSTSVVAMLSGSSEFWTPIVTSHVLGAMFGGGWTGRYALWGS